MGGWAAVAALARRIAKDVQKGIDNTKAALGGDE
ncbi:hypothetical protein CCACVL1_01822 [Corchorus capsularis]|uniref:Uncharacterized protein n=1 Tax=Corchorus capsularis TaxID=210143 RepID=A0A1R3KFG8_COCAP|nr:hypothetical protein CCACVL1_01822 [Corchorus capsularis]